MRKFLPLNQSADQIGNIRAIETWRPLERQENEEAKFKRHAKSKSTLAKASKSANYPMIKKETQPKFQLTRGQMRKSDREQEALERVLKSRQQIIAEKPQPLVIHADELLQIESVDFTGHVKPKPASRSPSQAVLYLPSPELLQLKSPKSQLLFNEAAQKIELPYSGYDPRKLQQDVDQSSDQYHVISRHKKLYAVPERLLIDQTKKSGASRDPKQVDEINFSSKPSITNKSFKKLTKTINDVDLSLGYPVGIVLGSTNIYSGKCKESVESLSLACVHVAHGMSYILPEHKWTADTLDEILRVASNLCESRPSNNAESAQTFVIGGLKCEVCIGDAQIIGKINSDAPKVNDCYQGLALHFQRHKAAVFSTNYFDLLVWKRKTAFLVFDCRGRTKFCARNTKLGKSALITLHQLENVVHLIVNMSNILGDTFFKIFHIEVTKLQILNEDAQDPDLASKESEFKVLTTDHGILKSNFHLGSPIFKAARNKQALPMCIVALIYSKLSPPNSWRKLTLDKVMAIGNHLYEKCLRNHSYYDLALDDIPAEIRVADYEAEISIVPIVNKGAVKATRWKFEDNRVTVELTEFFKNHKSGIFKVNRFVYGIFAKDGMFYLFDCYPSNDYGEKRVHSTMGTGSLHMFGSLEQLCLVFGRQLLELTPNENFYIHELKIIRLEKRVRTTEISKPSPWFRSALDDNLNQLGKQSVLTVNASLDWLLAKPTARRLSEATMEPHRFLNLDSPSLSLTQIRARWSQIRNLEKGPSLPSCDSSFSAADFIPDYELSDLSLVPDRKRQAARNELRATRQEKVQMMRKRLNETRPPSWSAVYVCGRTLFLTIEEMLANQQDVTNSLEESEPSKTRIIAKKILLVSDLEHLRDQRQQIQQDGFWNAFKPDIAHVTLSQELLIPSNFEKLPDGSEIVRGDLDITRLSSVSRRENMFAIVGISAVVVSYKYSIATWDPALVNFVLKLAIVLGKNIPESKFAFFDAPHHKFPNVKLGRKEYSLELHKIVKGKFGELGGKLEKVFETTDRVLVIKQFDSFAVFRRNNFFYLFEAFPCNLVGFRTDNSNQDSACFIRFANICDLVRRIMANRPDSLRDQSVLVSQVVVKEVRPEKYQRRTVSEEQLVLHAVQQEIEQQQLAIQEALHPILETIDLEKERIAKFKMQKSGENRSAMEIEDNKSYITAYDRELPDVPSRELPNISSALYKDIVPQNLKPGYHIRDFDGLRKIQGTIALSHTSYPDKLDKECFYTGIYATMQAIHLDLGQWTFRQIDLCLEKGLKLAAKRSNSISLTNQLQIDWVLVDDFNYSLLIKKQEIFRDHLMTALRIFFTKRQYLLLNFPNRTFALYKDNLFHLFDPYAVTETLEPAEKISEMSMKKQAVAEENTASWVLFDSLEKVETYLAARIPIEDLNFAFFTVNIMSYKKVPAISRLQYFMLQDEFEKRLPDKKLPETAPKPEEIKWLDHARPIPWSRLEAGNLLNQPRSIPQTVDKNFDIEIPCELFSLWGHLHPMSKAFKPNSGKQYLAVTAVACLMANLYHIDEWNAHILDEIVIEGDRYYAQSVDMAQQHHYELCVAELSRSCNIMNFRFDVQYTNQLYGVLYKPQPADEMNLCEGLVYFFTKCRYGILQCRGRILAVGVSGNTTKSYFMFDCQSHGPPLFKNGQGAAYVLRCRSLQRLVHCVTLTLNISQHNVEYFVHSVEMFLHRSPRGEVEIVKNVETIAEDTTAPEEPETVETEEAKIEEQVENDQQEEDKLDYEEEEENK